MFGHVCLFLYSRPWLSLIHYVDAHIGGTRLNILTRKYLKHVEVDVKQASCISRAKGVQMFKIAICVLRLVDVAVRVACCLTFVCEDWAYLQHAATCLVQPELNVPAGCIIVHATAKKRWGCYASSGASSKSGSRGCLRLIEEQATTLWS